MSEFKEVSVDLSIPGFANVSGTWDVTEKERKAAWEMYIELATRVAVNELKEDEGLLREALKSFHDLFELTRGILKQYGPEIAQPHGDGNLSFGKISVTILNDVLRPFLSKWHPMLSDHEHRKPDDISQFEHEKNWGKYDELRQKIEQKQEILQEYADILADVAEVPTLIQE